MRRTTVSSILILALWIPGCSDDNEKTDAGTTADQAVADQMLPDSQTEKKLHDYLPAGGEVSGWSDDVAAGKAGPDSGYTKSDIEDLINGSHDPFHAEGCNGFAQEQYKKTFSSTCSATAEIKVWECPTATTAKKMHEHNKSKMSLTWSTIAGVKDAGIIAKDSPVWRALGHKSGYVIKMDALATEAPCYAILDVDVESFMKVLTGNLP